MQVPNSGRNAISFMYPEDNLKFRREDLQDIQFQMGDRKPSNPSMINKYIKWYPWTQAILPSRPRKKAFKWRRRRGGHGFQRKRLFRSSRRKCAIYEIGVKVPRRKKIYAVFYKFTRNGYSGSIYKFLIKNPQVIREVDDIIKRKGSIWMRRGMLNVAGDMMYNLIRQYLRNHYSYAWKSRKTKHGFHRCVKKGDGFIISGAVRLNVEGGITQSESTGATKNQKDQTQNQNENKSASITSCKTKSEVNKMSQIKNVENTVVSRCKSAKPKTMNNKLDMPNNNADPSSKNVSEIQKAANKCQTKKGLENEKSERSPKTKVVPECSNSSVKQGKQNKQLI